MQARHWEGCVCSALGNHHRQLDHDFFFPREKRKHAEGGKNKEASVEITEHGLWNIKVSVFYIFIHITSSLY